MRSIIAICQKVIDLDLENDAKFKHENLNLTFDLKIKRGPPWVTGNALVKYHYCTSKDKLLCRKSAKLKSEFDLDL